MVTPREVSEELFISNSIISKTAQLRSREETGTHGGCSDQEVSNISAISFGGKYIRVSTGRKKR